MWDCIRNEGDHMHNTEVVQNGQGELIIGRRVHGKFECCSYGPCPGCKVWIKLDKTMYRHQFICPSLITGKNDSRNQGVKELRVRAMQLAGRISHVASKQLQNEVYTIMTDDEITKTAQADALIVSLGNLWLIKNAGNKLKRKYYTSSRMRLAARLLLNLRKLHASNEGFDEFLRPSNFDNIVKATIMTASHDMEEDDDFKAPSTALKLGYDIKRLVGAKWGLALRESVQDTCQECKDFMKLMKFEWSHKVSKIALITLQVRRFNAEKSVPNPDDIFNLQKHLKRELQKINLSDYSFEMYRRAEVLGQTRLLMYNKRRSGEVEVISIGDYFRRVKGVSELDKVMRAELPPLEVKLLETQDLMEVRGKLGRGVPIVIPGDLREVLLYLVNAEGREMAGVLSSNRYLFPNTSVGVIRAYDSLKMCCKEVNLKQPEKLTSVNLRKYTATISQIFDLSAQQQTWLTNHMGHTMDIHKIHYRQTSSVIERVDMAKLMLMQEYNVTAKYAGKKLNDIQLPEMLFGSDSDTDIHHENIVGEAAPLEQVVEDEDDYQPKLINDDRFDEYDFKENEEGEECDSAKRKKPRNAGKRVMRSKEELKEIEMYFKENLQSLHTPGKKEINKAMKMSKQKNGFIQKRDWETLKKKIWNMIQKRK